MNLPEAHRHQAVRLAALADAVLRPAHARCQGRGLVLYRVAGSRHGLEAIQIWETKRQRCVLYVQGCCAVLLFQPGPWCDVLAQWATEIGTTPHPLPRRPDADRVPRTLDLAATLLAEAAAYAQAVQGPGAVWAPLERLGCAVLRTWERHAVTPPREQGERGCQSPTDTITPAWTGNGRHLGTVTIRPRPFGNASPGVECQGAGTAGAGPVEHADFEHHTSGKFARSGQGPSPQTLKATNG